MPATAQTEAADQFVLATTYLSGPHEGRPQYFQCWTQVGPCATPDLAEAERFPTAQAAMQSPGYSHWSSFYTPRTVAEAAIAKAGAA